MPGGRPRERLQTTGSFPPSGGKCARWNATTNHIRERTRSRLRLMCRPRVCRGRSSRTSGRAYLWHKRECVRACRCVCVCRGKSTRDVGNIFFFAYSRPVNNSDVRGGFRKVSHTRAATVRVCDTVKAASAGSLSARLLASSTWKMYFFFSQQYQAPG